jgi:hypothetical protein
LTALLALTVAAALPAAPLTSKPGQNVLDAGQLPAGVYDLTFRLQVDRLASSVTPLATVGAHLPGYPWAVIKQITPLSFSAAGQPADFTLRLDNWTAQNVTALADLKKPPAGSPALTVEQISLAPAAGVVIGQVWPGKITYHRNEPAAGMVSVYNGSGRPQTVSLHLWLESDLDRLRPLTVVPLTLAPGERREVPVTWNTGAQEWGFALAGRLVDAAGQPLDERREYFSVSDNLWAVSLTMQQRGASVPFGPGPNASQPVEDIQKNETALAAILAKPEPPVYWNYGNCYEFFAWAPEDFFDLAPTQDYWYSGTGNYTVGKKNLQQALQWLHRRGIRATTYTNPFIIGYGSEKIYQRHPEWFLYGKNGQLSLGIYEKKLEVGEHLTHDGPFGLQLAPYAFCASPNVSDLNVIEQQEQQLVQSHAMFGWDGVRFDNTVYTAFGYDWQGHSITGDDPAKKNAIEGQAWTYLRAQLTKDLGPTFGVGTNFGWDFRDSSPAGWDAAARDGGLIMAEVPRSSYLPTSVNNRWVDYIARYHNEAEHTRALGGHYLTIGFDLRNPVDELYLMLLTFADRTHPYANVNSDDLPLGNYARFVTRYSALYYDVQHVTMLPQAEQRVTVDGPAPIWWKDYACVRDTPSGGKQYLINLVNPPVQERIYSDATNQVPAPQHHVEVDLVQLPGEKITRAYLLSADPEMTQTPLPLNREGDHVEVIVPTLWFWSLVVFE